MLLVIAVVMSMGEWHAAPVDWVAHCSELSTWIRAWQATIVSTPFAHTCSTCRAITTRRVSTIVAPPKER